MYFQCALSSKKEKKTKNTLLNFTCQTESNPFDHLNTLFGPRFSLSEFLKHYSGKIFFFFLLSLVSLGSTFVFCGFLSTYILSLVFFSYLESVFFKVPLVL